MLWQVPVTIATAQNKKAYKFVLDKPSMTITLDNINPQDWIKVRLVDILKTYYYDNF